MSAEGLDIVVIGAGIVGLATARRLLQGSPGLRLAVVEKEDRIGAHQTSHNSGVVHSGIYYAPGSLKARLCMDGKAALERLAGERGLDYERLGKVIVALEGRELPRLAELKRRAIANGVAGLRELSGDELRELEPNAVGLRALHAPETGVIDFHAVAGALADDVRSAGGSVLLGRRVVGITEISTRVEVQTTAGELEARAVVACAGVQADRVASLNDTRAGRPRIVPFRGDYYTLKPHARALVNGLVYPVPDPELPFLGVHFTKTIRGEVLAGPNAVLALNREGYGRFDVRPRDVLSTLAFPGFWRFLRRHLRFGLEETWRDLVKSAFVRELQRYVPAVQADDVDFGPSGIRAQALGRDGRLLDDFVLERTGRVLHVLNAPSPAATASLAIGEHLAGEASQLLG